MARPAEPRFRRRKADRPAEIVEAALAVFGEKGFAAARLDEIARRAGVSKGALYLYFSTKEELFRAVVAQAIAPNVMGLKDLLEQHPGPFRDLLLMVGERLSAVIAVQPLGGVARMVIGEARNFPELARVWHDELLSRALGALAAAVEAAQARGEVRPGDPRAYALQLVGPLVVGVIWRETFVPIGAAPFDLPALARQHVETLLEGLLLEAPETMNRRRVLILVLLLAAATLIAGLVFVPRFGRPQTLSGYIEGEPLYLAAPVAGSVRTVYVVRGAEVKAGAPLFVVDPQQPGAQRDQAAAELAAAKAQAQDARKGQRPVELAILDANVAAAQVQARNAGIQYRRVQNLTREGVNSQAQLDDARAAAHAADAQLAATRSQRAAAALGSREDQVRAADARVRQAAADLAAAEARLGDIAPKAPSPARVEDVFYQPGEWANANQPILSLLPDDRIWVRFFVPEAQLSAYRIGRIVRFSCDGCAAGLTAKIAYVSPRPEFTPPVIYSREARDRLVYLIQARPSVRLNPGQPVDVVPLEPGS